MKTKILIEINSDNNFFLGNTLWDETTFTCNLSFQEEDKNNLFKQVLTGLKDTMDTCGTDYISSHSSDDNFVRCPDAALKLPIDSFYCKHDKQPCFLGGGIFKKNKQNFIDHCRIADKKDGIWNAIITEKYEGFHHIPGRYLCPSCEDKNSEKRINYNYHYPWELCRIGQFFDSNDINLRREITKKGIKRHVYFSSYCAICTTEILKKLGIEKNFEIMLIDVYRKSITTP